MYEVGSTPPDSRPLRAFPEGAQSSSKDEPPVVTPNVANQSELIDPRQRQQVIAVSFSEFFGILFAVFLT